MERKTCGGMTSAASTCWRKLGHNGHCGPAFWDELEDFKIMEEKYSWLVVSKTTGMIVAVFYSKLLAEQFRDMVLNH